MTAGFTGKMDVVSFDSGPLPDTLNVNAVFPDRRGAVPGQAFLALHLSSLVQQFFMGHEKCEAQYCSCRRNSREGV